MIRLSKSCLGNEEEKKVLEVLADEYLGMGSYVQAFEKDIQSYLSTPADVVTVNTGTSAIHAALEALDLNPGDKVAVPSITYVACLQAIENAQLTPLICDVNDHGFLCIDDLKSRFDSTVKCILPVHYASYSGDMDAIYSFASEKNLRVVEDAAHSFGSYRNGKLIGSIGGEDIVCFSFDGIKNITSGEGGAVVTKDKDVASKVADYRLLSVENDTEKRFSHSRSWDFDVKRRGSRYHMGNIYAAIGAEQLKKIEGFRDIRSQLFKKYVKGFESIPEIDPLFTELDDMIPHIFVVRTRSNEEKLGLREHLNKNEIQTGEHYKPNHLLSRFRTSYSLPISEDFYARHFSIPLHCDMTEEDCDRVLSQIKAFYNA